MIKVEWLKKYGPHIFFLGYLILCIFVAVDRVIYSDLAYYLFNLIEHETYYAPFNRHFGVFTQTLALIGVKLNLPLKTLVLLFSINIALIPYLAFLIIRYFIKSEVCSWAPIVLSSICVHHAFFHINAGIILGLNFAAIGIALVYKYAIEEEKLSIPQLIFGIIILLIMLISHPLTIFTTIMFLGLLFLYQPKKIFIQISIVLILLVIAKAFTFSSYEQGKMGLLNLSLADIPHIINNYATRFMAKTLMSKLYFASLLTLLNFILLWRTKKKLAFIGLLGLSLGYMFLTSIACFRYETFFAYVEEYFTSFLFISSLFFIHLIFYSDKWLDFKKQAIYGLFIICFLGLFRIGLEPAYRNKTALLENFMEQLEEQENCDKAIIVTDSIVMRNILVNWSVPYESLLLSSLNGEKGKTIFLNGFKVDKIEWDKEGIIIGADWEKIIPISELNSNYFQFSSTPYCKINFRD